MGGLNKRLLCAGAALLLPASAAWAQATPAPKDVEEVVVTGSRIARKDYTAESPLVTVSQEFVQSAGPASMEATLNLMPQFAASVGAASTTILAKGGRANANLRGLGDARTLVLLDGRRMQPSDAFGAIDLNTISPALIESVEVITGGASAVYGSDAIAGVVNFKLKRNFEGLTVDGQYGVSSRGDAATYEINGTVGGEFADQRGTVVLSLGYFDREGVRRGERPFFVNSGLNPVFEGGGLQADASNLPTQAAINAVFAKYGITTVVPRNSSFLVNTDQTIFTVTGAINNRFPDGQPYSVANGALTKFVGDYHPLQTPIERLNVFGRATYQLNDAIETYGQFNYTHYTGRQQAFGRNASTFNPIAIPVTNPGIPADLRAILASRPRPNDPVTIYFDQGRFAPAVFSQAYNVYQVLGGFRGDIEAIDGNWDVYASYGRSELQETRGGFTDRAAYTSLVYAPDGGASICAGGLNPLSIVRPSEACLKYLLRELHESTDFDQTIVEGTIQGRMFDMPAGEARFAAGLSYRENTYDFQPDDQRINATILGPGDTSPTSGSTSSKEIFVEALLPLLKDLTLVKSLNLDVAYRYSDYDTVGGVHTYKAGGDWQVTDYFTVRGGYQRAIRAPGLGELFAAVERGTTQIGTNATGRGDPCDITSALRTGANGARVRTLCLANGVPASVIDTLRFTGTATGSLLAGNPDLKEEVADTVTVGLVWRSTFANPILSRLSASLDYYNIEVVDAIGLITGEVILQRCFNADGTSNPNYDPSNIYCSLITRSASGGFTSLKTPRVNLAGYKTSGVDLQVDWGFDLEDVGLSADAGAMRFNLVVSYVGEYAIQTLENAPFVNYVGTIGNAQISPEVLSHPQWKTVTSVEYKRGPATLTLRHRWIDDMINSTNVGSTAPPAPGVESRHYFDLTGRWVLNDDVEFRGGVNNIADEEPPVWTGFGATDPAIYDLVGRRFYLGVNVKF
jgi:outer membrane receptor protein involved in Fe transport